MSPAFTFPYYDTNMLSFVTLALTKLMLEQTNEYAPTLQSPVQYCQEVDFECNN